MEGPAHLLSLKVMRVSRPELASAWQPFYSSSPSFSAHSTASIVSLQGIAPLPGHPKTLRDLTHASELLTLPSSFGSIQLGETFSSCLCINNEAQIDIDAVSIKVEMQTTTAKVVLAEFGGSDHKLAARDTFETIVHHEIKELGQHVLACAVTYRMPVNARQPVGSGEHPDDPSLQTFRKFYKFAVTNPLSVKTKVHIPRSPSAVLSPAERDKVYLEVHIQNLTQEPMLFERMHFECAEGWDVEDANVIDVDDDDDQQLFSGPQALMQPQDIRQYIYILTPKSTSLFPVSYAPGTVVPLGRLDIFWRSSFGEPGRLLTSMLSRRIPIPTVPIQPPVSALPPYLKRTMSGAPPSRPQSPQLSQSRPGTPPPHRPGSPSQSRPSSMGIPRPQSPFQALAAPVPDVEVNLIIRDTPRHPIRVEKPFTIPFALVLSSPLSPGREKLRRAVKLVIQHLLPPRINAPPLPTPAPPAEAFSPRLPSSGFSTPSSATTTFNYALAHQKLVAAASPRQRALDVLERNSNRTDGDFAPLPPPYIGCSDELKSRPTTVLYTGSSAIYLPVIELVVADRQGQAADQLIAVYDFQLSYVPIAKGFATVGGLRVLLTEDRFLNEGGTADDTYRSGGTAHARVLKEWDVVSEVWVSP
ncbi:hypothetical protein D9615_001712 [Tricholomella constricta]|uniref:DUF974-domain-containing protein n=1 Tax=Tricholomella constricta TaxID=117010 RepID=A0A8H5HP64_9AGAR|nr:hypothetical protein D9615_001712 [Tricholomella constricta]